MSECQHLPRQVFMGKRMPCAEPGCGMPEGARVLHVPVIARSPASLWDAVPLPPDRIQSFVRQTTLGRSLWSPL